MRVFSAALFFSTAVLFFSTAVWADYQTEVGVGYHQHKTRTHPLALDTGVHYDHQGNSVQLNLYFSPVSTDRGPLSDAAFLNRSSYLVLSQDKLDFDRDENAAPDTRVATKTRNIGGFWADDDGNFSLSLAYTRYEDSWVSPSKFNAYQVGVGYYLSDSSHLQVNYRKYRFADEQAPPAVRSGHPETYQILYKNVVFSGQRAVTDIELQISKTPYAETLGTSLAWYTGTTGKLGIRVAMNNRDRLGLPSYHYGAFYEVFFDPQLVVRLTYDRGRHGVESEDPMRVTEHAVGVNGAVRF